MVNNDDNGGNGNNGNAFEEERLNVLVRAHPRRGFWRVAVVWPRGILWRAYRHEECPTASEAERRALSSLCAALFGATPVDVAAAKDAPEPSPEEGAPAATHGRPLRVLSWPRLA